LIFLISLDFFFFNYSKISKQKYFFELHLKKIAGEVSFFEIASPKFFSSTLSQTHAEEESWRERGEKDGKGTSYLW
jgi:hypothetical protein